LQSHLPTPNLGKENVNPIDNFS
jgi:serine/threonine protein kinase